METHLSTVTSGDEGNRSLTRGSSRFHGHRHDGTRVTGRSRRHTVRPFVMLGLASLCALVFLPAMSSGSGATTRGRSAVITLNYANFTAATIPGEKALVEAFQASHPDIHINLEELPLANYETNLELETRVHKAPDLFEAIPEWLYDLKHYQVPLDLSKQSPGLTQTFMPAGKETVSVAGQEYGAPFRIGGNAVFVNPALFKAAGLAVPTTWSWQTFAADAAKLTNSSTGVYGFAVPVASAESDLGSSWDWLTMLFANGGRMETSNGKAAFDSSIGVKALENYAAMYTAGSEPKSELSWITSDVVQQFCAGKVAMWMNGPWYITTIQSSCPKLKFQTVLAPTGTTSGTDIGGTFIGISSGTSYPKQAMEFLNYMTSTSVLEKWAADGAFIAPVAAVLQSPAIAKQPLLIPYVKGLSDPNNQSDSLTPDNTTLLDLIQTAIASVMDGSSSASSALKQAASAWNSQVAHPYGG